MIRLERISFTYKNEVQIFSDVCIALTSGKVYGVMGLSGSGKSTFLNIISGLQKIDKGRIYLNEQDITNKQPNERNVGYVFQDYGLFPNLSVKENIEYGLYSKKMTKKQLNEKVDELLELIQLKEFKYKNVNFLSGGQKQRVALARTLSAWPNILLLDEVFSAVDNDIKFDVRYNLKKLLDGFDCTTFLVSHSFDDVCHICDEVIFIINKNIYGPYQPIDLIRNPIKYSISKLIGLKNVIENSLKEYGFTKKYLFIPDTAFIDHSTSTTIEIKKTNEFSIINGINWKRFEVFNQSIYSINNSKYIDTAFIIEMDE